MAAQLVFDRRPRAVLAVNDSLLMIRRSSTHIIRNTDQLLGAFFQPIMFLVLFAAVFGGAISKALPPDVSYLNFLMPGIIVQTLAFGSTMTAVHQEIEDRKSTRLNSSHQIISYAVFCLKKKKN